MSTLNGALRNAVPYMGDECIKFILANLFFEVVQECEALFVGDCGECVVWIFALEVDD